MNKTYKVIWSKVRNAYVVVSELTKSHGKDKARHSAPLSHGLARAIVLGCLVVGESAMVGGLPAAEAADTTTYVREGKTGDATVEVTQEALRKKNDYTLAIGNDTVEADGAFALSIGGRKIKADGPRAIAIGSNETQASGEDSLAIGGDRTTANGQSAVSIGSLAEALGNNTIAIGAGTAGGEGGGGNAWSDYAIAIGSNSIAGTPKGYTPLVKDDKGKAIYATRAIAIGEFARSYGEHDVVIGTNSKASEPDQRYLETDAENTHQSVTGDRVVVGNDNLATSRSASSVVLGSYNISNSVRGIVIGEGASAGMPTDITSSDGTPLIYNNAMAMGTNSKAYGENSIAIGKQAVAGNKDNTTSDKNGQGAIALGEGANATSMYTTAIGGTAQATKNYAVSVGYDAEAKAEYALAMGYQAAATKNNAIAQGYNASAATVGAIAIGSDAYVYAGEGSMALGANSKVDFGSAKGSVALGANSTATRAAESTDYSGWNNLDETWRKRVLKKNSSVLGSDLTWNSTDGVVSIGTDIAETNGKIMSSTKTRQLTGLAAGVYDTDAVNMAQWKNTMLATVGDVKSDTLQTNYGTDKAPSTATKLLNESLTITGAGDTVRTDAKSKSAKTLTKEELTSEANIGTIVSDNQIDIRLAKNLEGLESASLKNAAGSTKVSGDGITITPASGNKVSLTQNGLDNGGHQITNVASGISGSAYDTTVKGQENWNNAANIGDLENAVSKITKASGSFGLKAGDGQTVTQNLGQTITVKGDKNIQTTVANSELVVSLKNNIDLGTNGSVTTGNTTINNSGVSTDQITINNSKVSINGSGINAGDTVIKNVKSGIVKGDSSDDTNGANIGDVKKIAQQEANASKAKSGKNITVDENGKVNLNDHITLGDEKDPSKQVAIDGNNASIIAGSGDNQVKLDGSKGQITAGSATFGKQDNKSGDSNPESGSYLNGLDNKNWDGTHIQSGRAATEDQLKVVDDKVNKGRVFQGDDGESSKVTVNMGDALKLTGGADASNLSDGNIGVVKNSAGDGFDVKLSKNISGLNSVTAGNTVIDNSGLTVKTSDSSRTITVQDGNVNMGKNVVTGVADGKIAPGSTDAVNGSQLAQRDEAINNIGGEVNKLGNRVNRVGAGAAALAALHPQDFDPDDKWDFAVGYGNYRGSNAAALGAFYRPNEDTTFSVGGTIGGGENMVNAGVSFKIGQGNHVSNSRVAMAKEIKSLREDVAQLEGIVNRQSAMINKLTGTNPGMIQSQDSELFPDIPANHWAYEYVNKLKQLGVVKGYPDGNFDGDRMMTRYEFATMLYRAIMAGAASNPELNQDGTLDRLAKEFSPELKYIRIDTIAHDKDGNPTIQRVRVIPGVK